ncbi:MAG: tryptophan-rich sensory protein [Kurthia sp.]|nr:tryptophan-rich sensory protein [Candidatus Kurthia equi]
MKRWVTMLIAFIIMLVVNGLGSMGYINGQSQSEISNKLDVLFTPAGYVFSIWGLIYILVLIWLIIQFTRRNSLEKLPQSVVILFILTCVFNILWLLMWHYEIFVVAQIMMFLLLLTLIILYMKYPKGNNGFGGRLPFSLYTGWISVATIANMAYTLKHYDVSLGVSEVNGTIGLLVVALLLAIATLYSRKDVFYALVFVWAIIGIGITNTEQSLVTASYITVGILVLAIIGSFFVKPSGEVKKLIIKK